ncbi:MAG: hypothetical protein JST89_21765 [Cyanobacteria bacterium SZAS-4]|nr:hypothetical protein [Cyanobacteria bacterium SZAS-4]
MGKNSPLEDDSKKAVSLEPTTTYATMWKEVSGVCFGSVKDLANEHFQLWTKQAAVESTGHYALAKNYSKEEDDAYNHYEFA